MLSTKSESDVASLAPSSPSRSPKHPVYYVQSPSRDSHDGDKSSTQAATLNYNNSPMESPSHPSFGHHTRNSSASHFSGIFWSSSGRKGGKKRNDKGWPECNVIQEEGSYNEFEDTRFTRRFQALMALLTFVVLFSVFCLIIWGASRPSKAEITVKSLMVNNFYVGEGSDFTGVPTRMLTVNGSLRMSIYNPATFFGIHVHSMPVNLVFSDITVATRQLKKYYQPRKSHRTVSVNLEGNKVPLYGAGSTITVSQNGVLIIPLTLKFEIRSDGNVVGKLVRTKHRKHISCPLVIDSTSTKPIKFKPNSCTYD
ncbi:Late embryogenesis abundant protein [Quillaja saponaria]|uniref:Late embryogenesis abundant protein n=1 Tax=Quillaja saponaria TaxID=32244 RepID=A0AAD7LRH0_QUISA|nr:Late embryogenesis abundant protein [Quillaja saponaria]